MTLPIPDRRRDLDQGELLALAQQIADTPELWDHHLAFDDAERHYVSLHRDDHVDVWLLCWTPQNDTGWHDHDTSSGAVAVTQGSVIEHNLSLADGAVVRVAHAGDGFSFGADHIHRMQGHEPGSVSIHVYSPPLWRMGQYTVGDQGVLRRMSLSYADELRPRDEVAPTMTA